MFKFENSSFNRKINSVKISNAEERIKILKRFKRDLEKEAKRTKTEKLVTEEILR